VIKHVVPESMVADPAALDHSLDAVGQDGAGPQSSARMFTDQAVYQERVE